MTVTKQQQIAQFLDTHVSWPRAPRRFGLFEEELPWMQPDHGLMESPRPAIEELARELLTVAEFRALQLGTWLGTTDGKTIANAVEMVTPPFYRQDVELLVAALQRAAHLQYEEGQRAAGRNALLAIGAAGIVAVAIKALGEAA